MLNRSLIPILILVIIGFLIAIYALLIQVFGIESSDKANIISGILGMSGGIIGAIGAYFVATYQLHKQIEYEKKKEEIQKVELIEQALKKLELLNSDVLDFVKHCEEEFSKPYNVQVIVKLKFREYDLQWLVNRVDRINDELLKEGYDIDYLKFNRALNNMYIDIVGFTHIPDEYKSDTLKELRRSIIKRKEIFISFEQYLKEQIKEIQSR